MSDHLHTVVVGTAKSLNEDVYYKKSKNKFWKSLYESGITHEQIAPNEWRKIHSYGIGFMELTHKIHPTDATITKGELDIIKFIKNIENINNLKNIIFNGKSAAKFFAKHINQKLVTPPYGLKDWNFKDLRIFVLPNVTMGINHHKLWVPNEIEYFNCWVETWRVIKEDNKI